MAGQFVVQRSQSKNSAIPMDQALEQAYNRAVKSTGGIIEYSRKKQLYHNGTSYIMKKKVTDIFRAVI